MKKLYGGHTEFVNLYPAEITIPSCQTSQKQSNNKMYALSTFGFSTVKFTYVSRAGRTSRTSKIQKHLMMKKHAIVSNSIIVTLSCKYVKQEMDEKLFHLYAQRNIRVQFAFGSTSN